MAAFPSAVDEMDAVGSILAGIIFWSVIGYFVYQRFKPSHGRNRSSWMRRQRGGPSVAAGPLPYQKKWYLLSPAERDFYDALRQAVRDRYLIFAKVRLLDLLWLPDKMENRLHYIGRVASKHVDFVLCHPQTVAPALVIELGDASHQLPERSKGSDTFIAAVLCGVFPGFWNGVVPCNHTVRFGVLMFRGSLSNSGRAVR